jgi:putative ABC transport system permease protein
MVSASLRASVTQLSRRRARTAFAVATLALAVASISFLAVPTLIDDAMQDEVRAGRLADVRVPVRTLVLTRADLDRLEALPNVAAVEPRSSVDVRVLVGERRAPGRLIGVADFARQRVDVVRVESGAAPARREALVEVQDANVGVLDARAGDTVTLVRSGSPGSAAGTVDLGVTGSGRDTTGGEMVQDDKLVVLYTTAATVQELSGERGYGSLSFLLDDPAPAAAAATVDRIRAALRSVPGFAGFGNLPVVRTPGDWPGKEESEQFADLLSVITVLALLSALVLIANTMTTLVSEQVGEIGVMRAVGARRRQVAAVYLRTALLLGALGAAAGVALGIVLAWLLSRSFGSTFWAVEVGLGVDVSVVLASAAVGVLAPVLAALPAIRRATRLDLRQALESSGSAVGGQSAGDRLLRRVRVLPRTMQIGLRSVGRRRRRSIATAAIVALAVGNLLAVMGVAAGATDVTRSEWSDHLEDIRVWTSGRRPFDERAARTIRSTPGVAEAEPALVNDARVGGEPAFLWAVTREPLLRYRLSSGRWFSAAEERERTPVAVIERNLARITGIEVGEVVTVATAAGPVSLRIVGEARNQQENGTVLFLPLTTARALLGRPRETSTYWIRTTSSDHALVDRVATALEDRLGALGYEVGSEITYVATRDNVASNRTVTTSITVLGLIIVAISMVGLANAMTTNVFERTREIGVLRCLGARARDVRRIFATEGLTLAIAGWLLGIPLGWLLDRMLVWLIAQVINVDIPARFPAANVLVALAGTIVLALLVLVLPVRRAVGLRPGDALRYG